MFKTSSASALTLGLSAALLAGPAPKSTAQPIVVKMATLVPDGSSWHQILKEAAERWKTLSGGRVGKRAGAAHRRKADKTYFGRLAPYFERLCLRSLTPWVSRTPRRTW